MSMKSRNRGLANFTDLYQLTMMYGYYRANKMNERVVFDLFFRKNPFHNGFTIAAGLEQVVTYLRELRFDNKNIDYLRSTGLFEDEGFFDYLRSFRFTGDLYAVPEGTVVFPNEPLLRFEGTIAELQLIETPVLTMIGFQTLIATKANRVVRAAEGRPVMEFGSRRAQEIDAALFGARAAVIGGCVGTSNVMAGEEFGLKILGTHAHSWVMSFDSELEAFQAYAQAWPDNLTLLVDTYDVLNSGVPNAITVFNETIARLGRRPKSFGIRLDSGDLTYLSIKARKMLDDAGYLDAKIVASNDLDENVIREIQTQGALIDSYGVGTQLITAADQPALGCVYKLAAEEINGEWSPRIKRSENFEKVTNPGKKKIVRFFDENTGEATVDLIMMDDEEVPTQPFEVFHPVHTYKRKTVNGTYAKELLVPIFKNGWLVYELPTIEEIAKNVEANLTAFPNEVKRFLNPHIYHVDLSQKVWDTKQELLHKIGH